MPRSGVRASITAIPLTINYITAPETKCINNVEAIRLLKELQHRDT
jgi:hypothetical protein